MLARVFGLKRMGFLLTLFIAALAAIGVPMNALFFQDGRHPAPLFARAPEPSKPEIASSVAPPVRVAKVETATPTPVELPRVDAIAAAIDPPRATRKPEPVKPDAAKAGNTRAEPKKPVVEKKRDLIGQLLGAAPPKAEEPSKNVLYAQQSLLRLGYVVRADGAFGTATRLAIEKFERDNGLPATGQVTPKLLKKLAAQSGATNR